MKVILRAYLGFLFLSLLISLFACDSNSTPPPPTKGTLLINNGTGRQVTVEINNEDKGTIDHNTGKQFELSPGSYTILLSTSNQTANPVSISLENTIDNRLDLNNLKAISKQYTITITAGKFETINHTGWDNGEINIQSTPSGAQIWLDGSDTGRTTPSLLDYVTSGDHTITCKLSDYIDTSQTVTIVPGQTRNVHISLPYMWVDIPAGCFDMGDHFTTSSDSIPVHRVCVSSFKIQPYEVTNKEYKSCVDAGRCEAPDDSISYTRNSYYGNSAYDDYPVIYVNWHKAKTYCEWKGGRLPTEAEWEYAARGGLHGKRYAWGNVAPTCSQANYLGCLGDTNKVGSYPANGYGLYDVAGNVREWCNDWYDNNYYVYSTQQDPTGPINGTERVLRGSSCFFKANTFIVSYRDRYVPLDIDWDVGFRCAK